MLGANAVAIDPGSSTTRAIWLKGSSGSLEVVNALSSNGLSIGMDASIRWRARGDDVANLHVTYGVDYYRKLVQPELRSAVREIVGQFTPEELYSSRRTELQELIFERVRSVVEPKFVDDPPE